MSAERTTMLLFKRGTRTQEYIAQYNKEHPNHGGFTMAPIKRHPVVGWDLLWEQGFSDYQCGLMWRIVLRKMEQRKRESAGGGLRTAN